MNPTGTILYVHADRVAGQGTGTVDALEAEFDVLVAEGALDAVKRLSVEPGGVDCVVMPASPSDLPLDAFVERIGDEAPGTPIVVIGDPPADPGAAAALVGVDAYVPPGRMDALPGRIRRLVGDADVDRAIDRHRSLARVVAKVAVDLAGAGDRAAVESALHDRLVGVDRYRHVWISTRRNDEAFSASAPAAGGLDPAELRDLVGGDPAFVDEAMETGRVVSTEGSVSTRSGAAAAPPADAMEDGGPSSTTSTAAVPFVHDGRVWGIGLLSTDRRGAFDGSERALLADLGAIVGHAIWAIESTARSEPASQGIENLVHEIRNPLGIARSHLEIAREDDEPESLDRVESAIDRLVETVDRAAIGIGGTPDVETSPGELREDVALAWGSIEAPEADLEVVNSVTLSADHGLVVRLLTNLLRNAVEHGGEDVSIRVGTLPDGFFVEDDGVGIPEEEREAVLERGYSTASGGLGIGLNIVEDVASAHGWDVSVAEGREGGARFEVTGVDFVEGEEGG